MQQRKTSVKNLCIKSAIACKSVTCTNRIHDLDGRKWNAKSISSKLSAFLVRYSVDLVSFIATNNWSKAITYIIPIYSELYCSTVEFYLRVPTRWPWVQPPKGFDLNSYPFLKRFKKSYFWRLSEKIRFSQINCDNTREVVGLKFANPKK